MFKQVVLERVAQLKALCLDIRAERFCIGLSIGIATGPSFANLSAFANFLGDTKSGHQPARPTKTSNALP